MAGRLGHIDDARRVGHVPRNGLRVTNYRYGFGGAYFDLDARFGTNTKTDLAAITDWTDQISNITFSQVTAANQPRFIAAEVLFNSFPCIDFHTNARLLVSTSQIGLLSEFTIAVVSKITTINTNNNCILANATSNPNGRLSLNNTTSGVGFGFQGSGTLQAATSDTNEHLSIITNTEIVIDGAQVDTGAFSPQISFSSLGGTVAASTNQNSIAKISRIIFWNTKLSSDECITLSTLMNIDYAIY